MKGKVRPFVGKIPKFTPILNKACTAINTPAPNAINPSNNLPALLL